MGIRICPDCGGKVSDSLNVCIHCGHVFSEQTKDTPAVAIKPIKEVDTFVKADCPFCGNNNAIQMADGGFICSSCRTRYLKDMVISTEKSENIPIQFKPLYEITSKEKYDNAVNLLKDNKYEEASSIFESIINYKDSKEKYEECKKCLENQRLENAYNECIIDIETINNKQEKTIVQEQCLKLETIKQFDKASLLLDKYQKLIEKFNEEHYQLAASHISENEYEKAIAIFDDILDYKDSQSLLENCKKTLNNEEIYQKAKTVENSKNVSKYKAAIKQLDTIINYKDSSELKDKYLEFIKQHKKKVSKFSAISALSALGLVSCILLSIFVFIPLGRQNKIRTLIDGKDYDNASELISKNGSFGSTDKYESMRQAGLAFDKGDYEAGIDIIYKAKGTVSVSYDTNGGVMDNSFETIKSIRRNAYITKTPNKNGYTFNGWSLSDYSLNSRKVSASINLSSDYLINTYSITYNLNGGVNDSRNVSSYTVEDNLTLYPATKVGYTFNGWEFNSNTITNIPRGTIGDLVLNAKWNINSHKVNIFNDDQKGSVFGDGYYDYNSTVTLTASPKPGYSFEGWFSSDGSLISNSSEYTFGMPDQDLSFETRWATNSYDLSVTSENLDFGDVTGSGRYEYGTSVTVNAIPNKGYYFEGWYDGSNKVSSTASYTFDMPSKNYSLVAKFKELPKLIVTSEDVLKGTVTGSGVFAPDSQVTVTATPNTGYSFSGWYEGSVKVSSSASYTFNMPAKDYSLVAKFSTNNYTLIVSSEDASKGAAYGGGSYAYGSSVTVTATPNTGYSFTGWYEGLTKVSSSASYTFNMPAKNYSLVAKFSANNYTLTATSEDTSKGTVSGGGRYAYNSSATVTATPKAGYSFTGWYEGSTKVSSDASYTFNMPASNYSLVAKFTENKYKLTLSVLLKSGDETYGEGIVRGSGTYAYNSEVTVTATPYDFNSFQGWYAGSTKVSSDAIYTFLMPANDYKLTAIFYSSNSIYYGLYPQTRVTNSTLISKLDSLTSFYVNSQGYYSYGGELYYPYIAAQYDSESNRFNDRTQIISGTKYWFKVEPIEWKVLDDNDEYFVASAKLLDAHRYNEYYDDTKSRTDYQGNTSEVYSNNYKYSEIRSWLNTDFYDMAFFKENSRIKTTEVDNSAATTISSSNEYVCENTNDKVFLLSYQDLNNSTYGFDSDYSRMCKPTDFALVKDAYYYGDYWTRSPDSNSSDFANYVCGNGYFDEWNGMVYKSSYGVRPALKLSL